MYRKKRRKTRNMVSDSGRDKDNGQKKNGDRDGHEKIGLTGKESKDGGR